MVRICPDFMGVTPDGDDRPRLTTSELKFFASEGYVVKHGVMDPALCRQLRDQHALGQQLLNDSAPRGADLLDWAAPGARSG